MSMDAATIALVQYVNSITGLVTIQAHQGIERPPNPYIMINPLNVRDLHEHPTEIEYVDPVPDAPGTTNVEAVVVMEPEYELSLHSYGPDPTEPLRILKSRMHQSQMQEPLFPAYVIHEYGTINNVPEWIKNQWEPRAHCRVFVRTVERDGTLVDVIDEITIDIQSRKTRITKGP